ncbi:hypothetical protein TRIATDRAFT_297968 [Trichoderma atroviride IMI 206040]|uniref:Secreted protein n=1 Tax=Hypocrea atroviridis (strain ATCC 20476 / IMI 206040) TaxID=452589 RepID=G9NKH1_HYPAI|nr:uncharacterized protein TRIATDRAFT_297968 [Trichoderma atroviride IMI 206040]EHK48394.1 hypothetical protein TRIATDRAFT_297968 [Trichoderma atroviride IMI 206040]
MLLSAVWQGRAAALVWLSLRASPAGSDSGSDSGHFSLGRSTYCMRLVHRGFPLSAARPLHLGSAPTPVPTPPPLPPSELSPALQASTLTKPVGPAWASGMI